MKKPPIVETVKRPKNWTAAKQAYAEKHYKPGPPAEVRPEHPAAKLPPIQRARDILVKAGIGEKRGDLYLLDGKPVTLGIWLQAANVLITRENMSLPSSKQKPLIGTNHHRWGQ